MKGQNKEIHEKFHNIINTFPQAKNGQPYLTLKNGKKLFFTLFIKKYGLNGGKTKYSQKDVLRRIRMIEFFDYITKKFDIFEDKKERYIIETYFFRMVIVETKHKKLELLSFYNFQ
ncbi:hypothetical protein MK079_00260 [Candidatus Gracilibacteria bacterium]|nr:hypothetical protein [Candidatus Gracilibacteria bacterium]